MITEGREGGLLREGSEGAAADDLDLTLRNACGIPSIETAYLKALACFLPPTVPLTHPRIFPSALSVALMHFHSIVAIFSKMPMLVCIGLYTH